MSTKLKQLEAQRRKLNAEIRVAKRAEAKRQREELLAARHALGIWLSESLKADSPEAIARIREVLDTDRVRTYLTQQLAAGSATAAVPNDEVNTSSFSYSESAAREEYPGHDA